MYVDEIKYFFNSIKKNQKTMNDINDGKNTLEIVLTCKKSSTTGKLEVLK